jgi:hypothetical protein
MLSDTIFDQTQNILTEVAWYYVCQDYDTDQVSAVIDSLATFSAIGIEFDIGGDGMLDSFISEDAKLSFIEDARKRLHERFNECLPEQTARHVEFMKNLSK